MAPFQLRPHERRVLSRIVRSSPTAKELTRAQALLWLDEDDTVEEVAQRLFVSRQTVYNWLLRFHQRSGQDIRSRLQDAPRQGRPPTALGIIDALLEEVLDTDPRLHGYRHTVWTAGLLQHYLRKTHGIIVCRKSISLAIARLVSAGNGPGMCWGSARIPGGKPKGAKTRPFPVQADSPPHA